jgi:hypothetical protein
MRQDRKTANGPQVPFLRMGFTLAIPNGPPLAGYLVGYSAKGLWKGGEWGTSEERCKCGLNDFFLSGRP